MPTTASRSKKASTRKKPPSRRPQVKRTVQKAAKNVHMNAEKTRELAAALIRAGELLAQGAAFLDLMATRASRESR